MTYINLVRTVVSRLGTIMQNGRHYVATYGDIEEFNEMLEEYNVCLRIVLRNLLGYIPIKRRAKSFNKYRIFKNMTMKFDTVKVNVENNCCSCLNQYARECVHQCY